MKKNSLCTATLGESRASRLQAQNSQTNFPMDYNIQYLVGLLGMIFPLDYIHRILCRASGLCAYSPYSNFPSDITNNSIVATELGTISFWTILEASKKSQDFILRIISFPIDYHTQNPQSNFPTNYNTQNSPWDRRTMVPRILSVISSQIAVTRILYRVVELSKRVLLNFPTDYHNENSSAATKL